MSLGDVETESFENAVPVAPDLSTPENRAKLHAIEAKAERENAAADVAKNGVHPPGHRIPPHSLEAETGLIGSVLVDPEPILTACAAAQISDRSFFDYENAAIFRTILDLHARHLPIDVVVLAEELKTASEFDGKNVFLKLMQVSESAATTAQAGFFIQKVREHEIRREIIRTSLSALEDAHNISFSLPELTDNLKRRVNFAISGPQLRTQWPKSVPATELCANPPAKPSVLIEGILYSAGTMLLSGPSKSHKTFSALDAALAISSGTPWLGHRTTATPVLYLNLELRPFGAYDRIARIASSRGQKPSKDLHIWNLRGRTVTLAELTAELQPELERTGAKVVCIDPHYKISSVSGMEENSNDQQGMLLTMMEGLCAKNDAALILTHHFAKGDSSTKNAIDRASGGGVFARWGDVMLTFTPHEEEDAMTIEMSLRDFPPVEPFVVRWEYPRWMRDKDLRPEDLKTARGPKERNTSEKALRALGDQLLTYSEWEKESGMSATTFKRKRQELVDDGSVEQIGMTYRKKRLGP